MAEFLCDTMEDWSYDETEPEEDYTLIRRRPGCRNESHCGCGCDCAFGHCMEVPF